MTENKKKKEEKALSAPVISEITKTEGNENYEAYSTENTESGSGNNDKSVTSQDNQLSGFVSRYSPYVESTLQSILDRKPYSYDINADAVYAGYKDMYEKAGRKAMEDTAGNAAILTGGYGNSYGVTAGQQAYEGYMDKLMDKSAELEERAYQRWVADGDRLYDELTALRKAEDNDYNRYIDSRDFQYKKEQDALEQQNYLSEQARKQYEQDRNYQLSLYKAGATLNKELSQIVEDNQDTDEVFDPYKAYDFIKKYSGNIYTDKEFAEALYQLYGEQYGFYQWLDTVKIPGDVDDRTYLELLFEFHPELTTGSYQAKKELEKSVYENATGGGATPPHSLTYNITG